MDVVSILYPIYPTSYIYVLKRAVACDRDIEMGERSVLAGIIKLADFMKENAMEMCGEQWIDDND